MNRTLKQVWLLRRMAAMISSDSANFVEGYRKSAGRLRKSKTNADFLTNLQRDVD